MMLHPRAPGILPAHPVHDLGDQEKSRGEDNTQCDDDALNVLRRALLGSQASVEEEVEDCRDDGEESEARQLSHQGNSDEYVAGVDLIRGVLRGIDGSADGGEDDGEGREEYENDEDVGFFCDGRRCRAVNGGMEREVEDCREGWSVCGSAWSLGRMKGCY